MTERVSAFEDLPNTQFARDLHESIKRKDVAGCSFAFTLPNDEAQTWSQRGLDVIREISDLDLHDVSPVTYPCYQNTSVDARQIELVGAELRSRRSTKKPLTDKELIQLGFRTMNRWFEEYQQRKRRNRLLSL